MCKVRKYDMALWLLLAAATVACIAMLNASRRVATRTAGGQESGMRRATLLFGGDFMVHQGQITAARRESGYDFSAVFRYVRPLFERADMVVLNLETTLSDSGAYSGYPCFVSPAEVAEALHEAGVDVVSTANNHCCDNGARGIRSTTDILDRNGIAHTGTFADSVQYAAANPLYLTCGGIKFALLSYTYGTNGNRVPRGCIVNTIDTLAMRRDIAAARSCSECVVVCIHWGEEYAPRPSARQRQLAEMLHRCGCDIVVGNHPHVVQSVVAADSTVTLYSLGNFVSNQRRCGSDGGILAHVEVTIGEGEARPRYAVRVTPLWVSLPEYTLLPPAVGDTLTMDVGQRKCYNSFMATARDAIRDVK